MTSFLNTLLLQNSFLMLLLDLLFKSAIIFAITAVVVFLLRRRLPSSSLHLLWLNSILCIALLPFVHSFISGLFSSAIPVNQIFTLTALPYVVASVNAESIHPSTLLLMAYLAISLILLVGLAGSGLRANAIVDNAQWSDNKTLLNLHNDIRTQLTISRQVSLKVSSQISSPLSFGLFAPAVILPVEANNWDQSTLESVLVHELSHIKRLDWPVLLLCRLICIAFWINPLLWIALAKVNENAEKSCDSAVVRFGKSSTDYAESLVNLAKSYQHPKNKRLLAQMILDKNTFSSRINHLLKATSFQRTPRQFLLLLPLLSVLLLVTGSKTQTFAAEEAGEIEQEYLPMSTIAPQYPTLAADQGIEGWVLMGFTVSAQGTVLEETVETIDSSPTDVFNNSAYRALLQFTFQPRIVEGEAVQVPGVQYLFRYVLEDDQEPDYEREPPPPRNAGNDQ